MYFLPLYGILRSILDKTYGIIIMFVSIICLLVIPFIEKSNIKGKAFKPANRIFFWIFTFNFLYLGFLGSQNPSYPYIELVYFAHIYIYYTFSSFYRCQLFLKEHIYMLK